jgi:hypothetical protein
MRKETSLETTTEGQILFYNYHIVWYVIMADFPNFVLAAFRQ